MLKVIQVKIQEQVSCKKKISDFAWFDQWKDKIDRLKYGSAEF